MTELINLLKKNGIQRAVVIDDVFDDAPRPDELKDTDWSTFFDDLGEKGSDLLAKLYPPYAKTSLSNLKESQEFIEVLWKNRAAIPAPSREHLFKDYENTNAAERKGLDALVTALKSFGLACTAMGRELDNEAKKADLIFVDLFLGFNQSGKDMERAIKRVSELVSTRADAPPLVVLMSRSSRLWDKRNEFRDTAGLLGSTFRVISKADLAKDGGLEILLTRLASHYEDAKRVAAFVDAWDKGLTQARDSFVKTLRRLDLSDLAQVRSLLLDFEGQKLGEYLLDVADRVLQHEIEAQSATIVSAQELNKVDLDKYPAPHLAGSPDLQDLVFRMVFQHVERLKLSFDGDAPIIQYGDIFRCKDEKTGAPTNNVFLVVTPACDLARCGIEHVLILNGELRPLSARDWSYSAAAVKVPIFTHQDGTRHWIKWELKSRQTIPLPFLHDGCKGGKIYERLGRIRETYTTEIQQRMLSDMGRIGQPANPPATFPVSISLFVSSADEKVRRVSIKALDNAVCFVGRNQKGDRVDHLVIGEAECDALKETIQGFPPADVHRLAQKSLAELSKDHDFFKRFERGLIEVPQKDGKPQEEKGASGLIYLHILRNEGIEEGDSVQGNSRNAPFTLKVSDLSDADPQPTPATEAKK